MVGTPGPSSRKRHNRSPSSSRRRQRQKYAQKACVSCRRSKLKCTGDVPCQRCADSNKRCFYSEDQTAAEVLQFLSRPSPAQRESFATLDNVSRSSTDRSSVAFERHGSVASAVSSTMEGRMARIEIMMETLIRERGGTGIPNHDNHCDRLSRGSTRNDRAITTPMLDPALVQIGQPVRIKIAPPDGGETHPTAETLADANQKEARLTTVPGAALHNSHMGVFFSNIHLRYPCLEPEEFRARADRYHGGQAEDKYFVALYYMIFACCEVISESADPAAANTPPAGWKWYTLAETMLDKNFFATECDDITLVQCLFFKSIYLAYADLPVLAYNSIRLTCTAALQQNLHNQQTWGLLTFQQVHRRMYLVWIVYIIDGRISASCGRPSSLRFEDVKVEMPSSQPLRLFHDREPQYDSAYELEYKYMHWMTNYAMLFDELMDRTKNGLLSSVNAYDLSERISQLTRHVDETRLPIIVPFGMENDAFNEFVKLDLQTTPLIVARRLLGTLVFRDEPFDSFASFADSTHQYLINPRRDPFFLTTYRHSMTSAIAAALLFYASRLIKAGDPDPGHENDSMLDLVDDMRSFDDYVSLLEDLAKTLRYAKRVANDFKHIMELLGHSITQYLSHFGHDLGVRSDWQEVLAQSIEPITIECLPYQHETACLNLRKLAHERKVRGTFQPLEDFEDVAVDQGGSGRGVLWLF